MINLNPDEIKLNSMFARFVDGEVDLLVEIAELMRPHLYDYLVRMTGRADSAGQTIDESVAALKMEAPQSFQSFEMLRAKLFGTVRSFSSHIWNADTSKLVNDAYAGAEVDRLGISLESLKNIEAMIGQLPGWEREPLLLLHMYGFSDAQAQTILSSSGSLDEHLNSALMKLNQMTQIDVDKIRAVVKVIPAFYDQSSTRSSTVALSQIMGDISKTKSGFGFMTWFLILVILVLIAALGYFYWSGQIKFGL